MKYTNNRITMFNKKNEDSTYAKVLVDKKSTTANMD
jgi:hypothetical protein